MYFWNFFTFLHGPVNVGNLISGFSAFSKPRLYIWKFLVHELLKPSLKILSITVLASKEKEMATHSSILAWKILGTEKLSGLQSLGLQKLDATEHTLFFLLGCEMSTTEWSLALPFFGTGMKTDLF